MESTADNLMPGKDDLLLVAGDIAHELDTVRRTLEVLQRLECDIFFIPGNHEAWLTTSDHSHLDDSIQKLKAVSETCTSMGVYTDHQLVGRASSHPAWIVPIQGWYDGSLTVKGCEEFCNGFAAWPWTDFSRCSWPQEEFPPNGMHDENARIPAGLTEHFVSCNEPGVDKVQRALLQYGDDGDSDSRALGVITVSHFLPNQQCLPDWKDVDSPVFLRDEWLDHGAPQISAKFAKVAGSSLLDEQLRSVVPSGVDTRHLHVFGHSHRPKDFNFQGIRYIHNPLGKPKERDMHMISPEVSFQLLWDTSTGEVEGEQVVRYWEEKGGGKAALLNRLNKKRDQSRRISKSAAQAITEYETSMRRRSHGAKK